MASHNFGPQFEKKRFRFEYSGDNDSQYRSNWDRIFGKKAEEAPPSRQLLIAVDVDEVCADLMSEWLKRYNKSWNDSLKPEDITAWDIEQFVKPECGKKIYGILSQPGFYESVKPFPWALGAVKALRTMGRVIFVTSCARKTMDDKFDWLVRNGFLSEKRESLNDFVACRDKWLIGADYLLDDAVHNVEEFRGTAFLVGHHHNRNTPCSRERIEDLSRAPDRIFRHLRDLEKRQA
jgi:5'-nucleotidase